MTNSFAFSDDVVGVLIDTELNDEKLEEITNLLEQKMENNLSVSLYLEDESKQGITLLAYLKSLFFHYAHPYSIRKVAIVTDLKWFQRSMEAKDFIIEADLKTFDISDRLDAMNWVMQ
ncbi:STAS/SEC14 domain-containing protein [Salinimicrobium tongyeongense]|jgi:hypothetical protein|uniref:STAS/SEC14 domain-containing protein n=1 Tax=Salinimicrobium tongyeongense TaxID=2809707 RepID=A0ABY6NTJ2_9FLAO|nr:STAS/SEC14 domain-containing protein [Salinimicrobium tongyeongense]UZH56234.1 STAS/SEC14 domain-containing protein [Salinimicrobium tongyeongense]